MIKKIFFILLAIVILQHTAHGQEKNDQRTINTRIADLLAQMPAKDAGLLKNNMNDIANLGEDGYVTLISGLTAPGKGNNALLEYTIAGFSAYVSQTGQEAWRKMSVNAYCKALPKLTDKQNKAFIISQLEMVGKDDAVACLQAYLTDNDLADPAARALVKINTATAGTALLNALPQANGAAKLAVIAALGDSRIKQAAGQINMLASGNDANLVKMALYALSHIGDPSSEPVLAAAAEKNNFRYDNTNAVNAYITYADQLVRNGNTALAVQVANKLIQQATTDAQVNIRTAALKILVDANKDNNSKYLLAAVDDKNAAYRAATLKFAVPYLSKQTTDLWMNKLRTVDDHTKADIVRMFGENNVKVALPAVLKLFNNKNEQVKLTAIKAAGNIGDVQVLDDLLKLMRKGDTTEVTAATNAILRMKGPGVNEKVAAAIPKMKSNAQIALINILAARAAHAQLNTVYDQLKNKDPQVKQAAYAALGKMVTSDDLPQLFKLLNESSADEETAVQTAVIAALKGNTKQADLVLQQIATAPDGKKLLFYKILASVGGDQSLKAVSEAYNHGDEPAQKAALAALASWVDPNAAAELIKIARTTNNADLLNQAIKGYLRLIKMSDYPAS